MHDQWERDAGVSSDGMSEVGRGGPPRELLNVEQVLRVLQDGPYRRSIDGHFSLYL